MDTEMWIAVAIAVAVVLIAVFAWVAMSKRRTTVLREEFGPEYDRTLSDREDRRAAESELAERRARRDRLAIRPLEPAARARYIEQWNQVQSRFVDQPALALAQADELVSAVMRDRGYPMDDFDQRAADVSVDHPVVVENYRHAHRISGRVGSNQATTEDMRQGLVHYRALFAELLDDRETADARKAR
jgi:hypothetical protein